MTLLRVARLSKRFGGVTAVDDVSFTVEPGEMVGLIGANGAGKTTLFNMIAATDKLTSGQIFFDDRRTDRLSADQVCRLGIARTFQIVRPFRGMSVFENVRVAALFGAARSAP